MLRKFLRVYGYGLCSLILPLKSLMSQQHQSNLYCLHPCQALNACSKPPNPVLSDTKDICQFTYSQATTGWKPQVLFSRTCVSGHHLISYLLPLPSTRDQTIGALGVHLH